MAQDIDIYHIEHHGLLVGTLDNILVDAPTSTIMKIEGRYIICMPSTDRIGDCRRCAAHHDNGGPTGLCATLMCQAHERSDRTQVYFTALDIKEVTGEEGRV